MRTLQHVHVLPLYHSPRSDERKWYEDEGTQCVVDGLLREANIKLCILLHHDARYMCMADQ